MDVQIRYQLYGRSSESKDAVKNIAIIKLHAYRHPSLSLECDPYGHDWRTGTDGLHDRKSIYIYIY